jgi:hypothetical protein
MITWQEVLVKANHLFSIDMTRTALENDASNNSSLPRERLYRLGTQQREGDTQIQTHEFNDSCIAGCIHFHGDVFADPLRVIGRGDYSLSSLCSTRFEGYRHRHRHADWWEEFMKYAAEMCSDTKIYTPFLKDWFRRSKVDGGDAQNHGKQWRRIRLLFFNKGGVKNPYVIIAKTESLAEDVRWGVIHVFHLSLYQFSRTCWCAQRSQGAQFVCVVEELE